METLTLSSEIGLLLEAEAQQMGKTTVEIAEDWLRQHYSSLRRQRLEAQTKRFWAKHTELYAQYPDQFVAFYDDRILDVDEDMRQLAMRVRSAYGKLPVVIAQVTATPVPEYRVRSPRLSDIAERADENEMSMDEIVAEVHRYRQETRDADNHI
ncbi:MAG: hypothetical protein KBG20_08775 [Caldilineaceae bacterium]|nr:hypothetical protein [Caldilineaceae bacterium]MBP8106955.1 hypothetical protein [Caldilineaceae bacterium]MBP8121769.1 hypothetical protein [Caldilineaceae bacterium]MBP9072379.1 hypothetical protein [Caldilineaceae bacterium]